MSSSDNNSYMTEMTKSANGLTGKSENSTDDDDEEADENEFSVSGRQTSPSLSSSEIVGTISVCGQTTCFNGGRCNPITRKCKCKGHHAGQTDFRLFCSNYTEMILVKTLKGPGEGKI